MSITRFLPLLGFCSCLLAGKLLAADAGTSDRAAPQTVNVGTYAQQFATKFTGPDSIVGSSGLSVAILPDGQVWAGAERGAAHYEDGKWIALEATAGKPVSALAHRGSELILATEAALYAVDGEKLSQLAPLPAGILNDLVAAGDAVYAGMDSGLYQLENGQFRPIAGVNALLKSNASIRQVALGPGATVAVAADAGLFEKEADNTWRELRPHQGPRSWAATDVRGVAYDPKGRLWFSSPQGAGFRDESGWQLFTGEDGLPYNDFTKIAAGAEGSVWFGTKIGAIRFDGENWEYRQGLRWLPGDEVRDVAAGPDGSAFFATDKGIGLIGTRPTTLAEKARMFEDAIDRHHRRTPYGYVLQVRLPAPGDTSSWQNSDSDNDGLWTSMYGAAECFAYAATKDPYYKERAQKAFQALKFLMDVTQGGTPPAQEGFVARTVLPTSGPNPNEQNYTPEKDRQRQRSDRLWKVMDPRWGTSADGQWYWKSDTSSDELDGHYFFYATYYDLVCETEEEKADLRSVVAKLSDHLVRNNFQLVDHDGKPTRWAVYDPERFNKDPWWAVERGLNSLSILSYLATADHVTGDRKYRDAMDRLIDEHGYAINVMVPKAHVGPGSGNQSDDEMAFMSFYNLMKCAPEGSRLQEIAAYAWWGYWTMERPELNPLFNFMYASQCYGKTFSGAFGPIPLSPRGGWLEESVDSLKRYPLDRIDWKVTNSHRIDLVPLPNYMRDPGEFRNAPFRKGYRTNGKVLPIDERFVEHWNHDPWQLDQGGNGGGLADGASFLLPYYMGLYHKFLQG